MKIKYILLCFILVCPAANQAAKQTIQIQADQVDLRRNENIAVYSGNVHIKQDSLTLRANNARAKFKNGAISKVVITGKPVQAYIQVGRHTKRNTMTASRAVFDASENKLHLFGGATVQKGADKIRAAAIEYNINTQELRAFSNEQDKVIAIIHPEK